MGFDIHTEDNLDYTVHFTMWDWDRFLDTILWLEDIITLKELKHRLIQSHMTESTCKAIGSGNEPSEFDLKEWEDKVSITRQEGADVAIQEIGGHRNKEGRMIFEHLVVALPSDPSITGKTADEVAKQIARTGAFSIALYQGMEDKIFDNRKRLKGLYGIQTNKFDLGVKGCWKIYDYVQTIILPEVTPDFIRDLVVGLHEAGVEDDEPPVVHGKRPKSRASIVMEGDDCLLGEYMDMDLIGRLPRLMGIIINGILGGNGVLIR